MLSQWEEESKEVPVPALSPSFWKSSPTEQDQRRRETWIGKEERKLCTVTHNVIAHVGNFQESTIKRADASEPGFRIRWLGGWYKERSRSVTGDMQEPLRAYCWMRQANRKGFPPYITSCSAFWKGTWGDSKRIGGRQRIEAGREGWIGGLWRAFRTVGVCCRIS